MKKHEFCASTDNLNVKKSFYTSLFTEGKYIRVIHPNYIEHFLGGVFHFVINQSEASFSSDKTLLFGVFESLSNQKNN